MLRYPCLVLDHDDTVVQSEKTIHYPCVCRTLEKIRPGQTISLEAYFHGCCDLGFMEMCRQKFHFTEEELYDEYLDWKEYIRTHIPEPFPGIDRIIYRQKAAGGLVCVVSHSSEDIIKRDYLAHFAIQPDVIYGRELSESQQKPSIYPLKHIMQTYNLSPSQILVVDDLKPAYEMASKAGVSIAFAKWGKPDFPKICQEMQTLCDYTFESPPALEQFLFD